jgi:hypothetical protein
VAVPALLRRGVSSACNHDAEPRVAADAPQAMRRWLNPSVRRTHVPEPLALGCLDARRPQMKATLEKAWGYQGDNMNLPVRDLAAVLPFYETVLGFRVLSRSDTPHNSAFWRATTSRLDLRKTVAIPPRTAVPSM